MLDKNSKTDDNVNVFSIDDAKMKILAKVISNKSSVTILNLLYRDELTANAIAQKTNMSLQLVKYYLDKMRQIDLVRVSKTGKNSKARDMNYYKTSKLAIVITPSKIAEKTRQSKSLVRSFHSISRFFGMATVSAIAALSLVMVSAESSLHGSLKSWYSEFRLPVEIAGTGISNSIDESLHLAKTRVESVVANPGAGSGTPYVDPYTGILSLTGTDFVVSMAMLAGITAVASFVLLYRAIPTSNSEITVQS
ncbi:MAG: winged helix-turn-helix transcriptional regulator [Nitrosopumilus sp.]|nr:MAG: winged helix-turn-helix transcriptional regulator [Nitrosopumilus sp.]